MLTAIINMESVSKFSKLISVSVDTIHAGAKYARYNRMMIHA